MDMPISPSKVSYCSERGIPLLYVGPLRNTAIITLENCDKWYGVEMINPDGKVTHVSPNILDEVVNEHPAALMGDHGFTPHFLYRLAEFLGAWADSRAVEVAGARWLLEQEGMTPFFYL